MSYSQTWDLESNLWVAFSTPLNRFQKLLLQLDDATFATAIKTQRLSPIAFYLTELRTDAKRLLDDSTESLINQFDLDGQQAWSQHYDTISASLSMNYTDETGKTRQISAGQALNMLDGEPNNETRANIMANYEKMWGNAENLTADTLNHLAGFRLTNQKAHQRQNYLEQPLEMNRMSEETLKAMWQVVDNNKGMFKPYFERKKALLGLSQLGWQDQVAPLTNIGDYSPKEVSYDEAAQFIITQFVNDAATIAHEFGHAFHSAQLNDLPFWRDAYAMNVAETASTFAELIVNDANVKAATTDAEKVVLLDAKMTNPISMFLNIHARFLFEDAFYTERQNGVVTPATTERIDG
ncbi:hypothetical protein Pfo_030939 [Paulownia fortunei]|nr:hypothetical protein Pfo_030939 [Paulownia fortunei]